MEQIIDDLSYMFYIFFNPSTTNQNQARLCMRLVQFIVSDPLIMAVIAFFFVGFVVSIFLRLYHSS